MLQTIPMNNKVLMLNYYLKNGFFSYVKIYPSQYLKNIYIRFPGSNITFYQKNILKISRPCGKCKT